MTQRSPHKGEFEMETTMKKFMPEIEVDGYTRLERSDGLWSPRSLLIPDELAWALAAERAVKPDADKADQFSAKTEASEVGQETDTVEVALEDVGDGGTWLPVFDAAAVSREKANSTHRGRDFERRTKANYEAAERHQGRRRGLSLDRAKLRALCRRLAGDYPNFAPVIAALEIELMLALAMPPESFRVTPILLHGAPGIGKTRFASALADYLQVGFEKLSAGSAQGAFELTGGSAHWSNSSPGRLFEALARGDSASLILLVDEIDKMSAKNQYPLEPALLDLLEEHSARRFRDDCMGLEFDASHVIVLLTANDLDLVSAPLRSRVHAIEVRPPSWSDRRHIADIVFRGYQERFQEQYRLDLSPEALDRLAEAPLDLRGLIFSLKSSMGTALLADRRRIEGHDLVWSHDAVPEPRRMGFI
jgi:ATP-dependent Lon protease